jgi:hypothetical protein
MIYSRKPIKIKKFLKPLAKAASSIILWMVLLVYRYFFRSWKNHIPSLIVSLSLNEWLVFKVDPGEIKHHIKDPDAMQDKMFVWSGDWDREIIDIWEHEKFKTLKELLIEKKEYKDIGLFSFAMRENKAGRPISRGNIILDSEEEIIGYFKKQEKLFTKIKSEGFDLRQAPETGIAITREGRTAHYRQGHHTLAMARILGADMVKVRIRAVHSLWLKKHLKKGGLSFLQSIRSGIEEIKNGS